METSSSRLWLPQATGHPGAFTEWNPKRRELFLVYWFLCVRAYISVVSKRVVIIRSTRKEWFTVHFCLIYRWEWERDFEIKKAISERSVLQECIFRTAGRKKKKAQRGRSSMSMANSYIPLSMTRHLCLFTFEVIIWHLSLTITGKIKLWGIFWKYCIKGLENPISIVFSISIVWKCFPWYGNILEMKLQYCERGPVFPVYMTTWKYSLKKLPVN